MKTFLIFFFPSSFFIHHFRSLLNNITQWMENERELFALLVVANEMKWEFFPNVCSVGVCFFFAIFSLSRASSVILIATCYMIMAFVSCKAAHRMCGELFWSGFNCRVASCSSAQITLTLIQSAHLSRNNHLNPHRNCIRERMISSELSLSSLLSWESGNSPATATTVARCRQKISSLPRWLAVVWKDDLYGIKLRKTIRIVNFTQIFLQMSFWNLF